MLHPSETPSSSAPAVDRRSFLAGAGTAAAALGAASASAATPPRTAVPATSGTARRPGSGRAAVRRKAVKLGMVRVGDTVKEKFELLAKLGFDSVEIDSPSKLDLDEVVAARDATGLDVHGVVCSTHWSAPLSHPDPAVRSKTIAGMRTALRDARKVGATTALLVPAVVRKEISYGAAWERSTEAIRSLLPIAAETGVQIAFENVWNDFLLSPLEARRYIEQFDSPWVGLYFDAGNLVRYAWPMHWVEAVGDLVLKVDVKDYSRKKRDDEGRWKGFQVGIGEGDTGWDELVPALEAKGYSGWYTAEVGGGDEERLRTIAERMDAFLKV